MLVAIGDLTTTQPKDMNQITQTSIHLFKYVSTHPDNMIALHGSNITVYIDSGLPCKCKLLLK